MFLRRSRRRRAAAIAATITSLATVPIIASADAQAPALSSSSRATYQTNGRVSAILVIRNTVYIGGDFTAVRPPHAAPGTKEVPRAHAAAFLVDNGKLRGWHPHPNGPVDALESSSHGRIIYLGGSFTTLAGAARHTLGAVDGKTGSVLKFHANTNGTVLALSRNRSRLYLGGVFNTVRHKPRQHVAAVGMKGRLIRTWHPRTKGTVRSIRVARHGTPVYLGGAFTQINDQPGPFLAKVSAKGKVLPWRTYPDHPVWSLVVVSGHIFAGGNGPGGYVEAFSRRGGQGWNVHTDGGVQAMTWFHGALLVGGHFRKICTVRAGHGCAPALAFRDKLFSLNPATGALQRWNPAANSGLGVFAIRGAGSHVYVGGVFTKVNNLPQQGFDSFIRS
jgi:hypothetical protein